MIGKIIRSARNSSLVLFSNSLNFEILLDKRTIKRNAKRIHINNEVSVPPISSLYIVDSMSII